MAPRSKDHDVLIRIDERTAALTSVVTELVKKFDIHVDSDNKSFESLKKWRAYITGFGGGLGLLGAASGVYAAFIR